MTDSPVISPDKPDNRGLDYAWLKEEGTRLVQEMAGEVWTDYNEHDPGVTTLEQLCYALTDLSYRAEFPLADLLADPRGRIDARRQALFVPRRILPCNPVTVDDYRKLLVDRCEGVANAWLVPRRPASADDVDGLYDLLLYAPGADPCACDEDFQPEAVRERARRVFCRHRNLCEDVSGIDLVEPLATRVAARVTVDESRAPDAVLAELLFNVSQFFAPELRRRPLSALVASGIPVDAIFEGPLLRRGFIADRDLEPKAAAVALAGIVRVMARTPGVIGLSGVSVQVGDGAPLSGAQAAVPVPPLGILQLELRPGPDGFPIRLWRKGVEIKPDPARVKREYDRLLRDQRRTYALTPPYEQFFAMPTGRPRDLGRYYSLQNQYPAVYGINAYGVSDEAGPRRKAQAKQLKGYLLAFEQLLADFLAQLAHVKELYSTDADLARTSFYQGLERSVPGVAPLLRRDYLDGLARIVADRDPAVDRRNRFLDVLLALYGEAVDDSTVAGADAAGGSGGGSVLHAKLALLRALVPASRDRGRGFDYRAEASPHNLAGMLVKSRIQLGMEPFDPRPRGDLLAEWAIEVVEDDAAASVGRPLSGDADHIEEHFATPATEAAAAGPGAGPLQGQRVTERFLHAAADIENLRVGGVPGEGGALVVLRARVDGPWHLVGRYPDRDAAHASIAILIWQARRLRALARQVYIVEHALLRHGRDRHGHDRDDHAESAEEARTRRAFAYDFTVTAVVTRPHRSAEEDDDGTFAREVLRANAPAHVAVDVCVLRPRPARRFEHLQAAWRDALRRGDPDRVAATSARLRRFLQHHRERQAHPGERPT